MLYAGMFLAASLSPLGSTMIAVALPSISGELGVATGTLTQWLVSSYLIVGIASMTPLGKLGDIIGHQKSLVIGMIIYGVGSAAGFVFATLPSLALARISMAIGGAMSVPATMALLRNVVPPEKRPRTFGYFGSVMGTAAAIGPLLGGELTARFGWRAVFVGNIPIIILALAMIRMAHLRANAPSQVPHTQISRFDIAGSLLLGGALTLLVVAAQTATTTAFAAGISGAVLLVIFVIWERRVAEPVLDLRLFLRRSFAAGNGVIALQNLAMYALLFQLPIFFEQVRGVQPGVTGRTIIGMMIAMVVFAPFGGRLSERIGARTTVFIGSLSALAGLYLIGSFAEVSRPAEVLGGLILVGTGLGLSTAPSQAAAMNAVNRSEAGMAGGALSMARYIGGIVGISALGYLLESSTGVASHTAAATVYEVSLALAAVTALALPGRRS
jgi:EmrB/QacA subfamily drug resistance transporter